MFASRICHVCPSADVQSPKNRGPPIVHLTVTHPADEPIRTGGHGTHLESDALRPPWEQRLIDVHRRPNPARAVSENQAAGVAVDGSAPISVAPTSTKWPS